MDLSKSAQYVSQTAQIGGIETSVLDNGVGRGNRIAWFNTGAGLRFKVLLDRALDIADASINAHSLTWLGHGGIPSPQPFSNKGIDWLHTFGGGLLTTCGLQHVGGPESDHFGERGVHGNISNQIAEIESIIQPNIAQGLTEMSITGTIKESKIFGPNLLLKRRISASLGKNEIKITDKVTNFGNTEAPFMLLYHFNFGYPLVQQGTQILWEGDWKPRHGIENASIFKAGNSYKTCPSPIAAHKGSGEEVALITPTANDENISTCGLRNETMGLEMKLSFNKTQLPKLTNWQHWATGEYVTGLEPGTHWPIGQKQARENNELIFLQPGDSREFDLVLTVNTF